MNKDSLVSIIMPAYNSAEYLDAAIQSVLKQTHSRWELILINDGSTDDTALIIENYAAKDDRIQPYDNGGNLGLVKTRNNGLKAAKGKYIALLDSDDLAYPERLEKQVNYLDQHMDYVLLGTACYEINQAGDRIHKVDRSIPNDHLKSLLVFSNYFINSSVMIRAAAMEGIHYLDGYAPAEDYQLFTQLAKKGSLANLNERLVDYRIHDQNISSLKKEQQQKAISQIAKIQLLEMGIDPTEEELRIHHGLVHGRNNAPNQSLQAVEQWLGKLIAANQESGIYPESIFNFYCAFFFRRICQHELKGIKAIRYFRNSQLYRYTAMDVKGNSIFFVKSILRK